MAIKNPEDQSELRSFFGMVGYYRRFIKGFSNISASLYAVSSKKKTFVWTEEMDEAFQKLKQAMSSPPVLAYPDFYKHFIVETDSPQVPIGAVLAQKGENGLVHPVQYTSRTMKSTERFYDAFKRETLAVVFALRQFRVYLLSAHQFTLIFDHRSLKDTFKKKFMYERLTRCLNFLAEYEFTIQFRSGKENIPLDYLSLQDYGPPQIEERYDQRELVLLIWNMSKQQAVVPAEDSEERITDVLRHFSGETYQQGN